MSRLPDTLYLCYQSPRNMIGWPSFVTGMYGECQSLIKPRVLYKTCREDCISTDIPEWGDRSLEYFDHRGFQWGVHWLKELEVRSDDDLVL